MPLYEYQCQDCKQISEVIQKLSDPDPTHCKECGGTLERLLSAPAIRFKGSGWYVNDYGKSNGGGPKKSGAEASSSGNKADSSKSAKSGSDKKNSSKVA